MCMICASIPAVAAAGAKLNVDQLNKPAGARKPIGRTTGLIMGLLVFASVIYHALRGQAQ